jgi:putative transposase
MSRKGDCGDNAVTESIFGGLKQESVQWRNCQTRYEAWQAILNYIAMFYNPERLHPYPEYKSPSQHEAEMSQLQKVA